MTTVVQVITTVDTRDKAESIAAALVESRLAACIQIDGPISSTYRWQGTVEHAMEFRLTIKCTSVTKNRLIEELKRLHPYEVPEILWFESNASEAYASWVAESVL